MLSVFKSHISLSCPEADSRGWKPPCDLPQALPSLRQAHRQKFLEGWGAGRESLFPKRFPSPQSFSSLQIFISCLRSCPARKIPPEKRLPPFETTVWGAPGRAPHQARPPAGSGETPGAGGALAVVPQPVPLLQQKNPRWTGDKKRPPRAESGKGVSNDLWQRPTFPHDVMQYHRRWRA